MARKKQQETPPIYLWERLPGRLTTEQFADLVNCDIDAVRGVVDAKVI